MHRRSMKFFNATGLLAGGAVCSAFALPAMAQTFPSKTIRVIVPFPAGGTADALPRILAERLRASLGQPVVVENRPGAGGNIGAELVYRAEPDGHTLLASPPGPLVVNQSLYPKLGYDATKFVPLTVLASVPTVLAINTKYANVTLPDFIAQLRANNDRVSYASQGNGSISHLSANLFQSLTSTRLIHVPYRGTAPALADLIGGQVDLFFDNLSSSMPQHQAGKVRIIAVADHKRAATLSQVPTFAELGYPAIQSVTWFAMVAPPGTPEAIANRLNAALGDALKLAEVQQRFTDLGAEPGGGSRAATARFMRDESQKWRRIIVDSRVTID